MIENKLHHDFWAVRDIDRVNWIGKFQTALGVNYVRGDEGIVRKFETKVEAAAAAARALCNALDEGTPPRSLAAKVFRTTGTGRYRRAIPIPASRG